MGNDSLPVFAGILIALIGSGAGWAAYRRAGAESAKDSADAARAVVGTATDVVKLLREQMAEQALRIDQQDVRVARLEVAVGLWEGWAEKALALLDRAMTLIVGEHVGSFREDVETARRTRPPHHRAPTEDPDTGPSRT